MGESKLSAGDIHLHRCSAAGKASLSCAGRLALQVHVLPVAACHAVRETHEHQAHNVLDLPPVSYYVSKALCLIKSEISDCLSSSHPTLSSSE